MFNKIIEALNGHGSESESLEAALLQLGRDRDEASAKIVELKKQRHQALLDDETDAAIGKIDLAIERAEVRLEKLDMSESPLRERLAGAKAAARERRWRELHEAYVTAAGEFLGSARAAAEKHTALIAIVGQAQREGFSDQVCKSIQSTPNVNGAVLLAPELLDIFERSIMPPAAPARRTTPAAATRSAPPKPAESLQHAISLEGGVQLSTELMRAKRRAPDTAPLGHGEVRAKVLRSGYSPADDQPQCHRGDVIRLPRKTAEMAAAHGVIEIIEELVPRTAASTDKSNVGASSNG